MSYASNHSNSMVDRDVESTPLDVIDVSQPELFERELHHQWFERLRREDPVHFCTHSAVGPFWSITKMKDVMAIESDYETFSAGPWGIIGDTPEGAESPAFIFMDPPEHDPLRMAVQPVVAPKNLQELELLIRERACDILDALPLGERFNWVERVSIELTSQMLATLMGFPLERRYELIELSEIASSGAGSHETEQQTARRLQLTQDTYLSFKDIWQQRLKQPAGYDLISLLQQSDATKNMIDDPATFMTNLGLLIIGGNDTTRNSISGGVLALNQYPEEYQKLRDNPALIATMVPEIIRWQTPLLHHRRNATRDVEFGGKTIRKGDQVVLWWCSANRDESAIENANRFIIDRKNPRLHASFGFGVHRCMGNRLAEMQLRVLWEEIMKRYRFVEVVAPAVKACGNHFNGYSDVPVQLHPW